VTVWSGAPRTVEFTYLNHKGETLRRKVDVSRISQDPTGTERFYLHGYCRVRKEDRTFNAFNIQTKILDKSQRYDALDWIEKIAGIDPYA
jgi:predicted DNA-binding transcriptional regulator YafY